MNAERGGGVVSALTSRVATATRVVHERVEAASNCNGGKGEHEAPKRHLYGRRDPSVADAVEPPAFQQPEVKNRPNGQRCERKPPSAHDSAHRRQSYQQRKKHCLKHRPGILRPAGDFSQPATFPGRCPGAWSYRRSASLGVHSRALAHATSSLTSGDLEDDRHERQACFSDPAGYFPTPISRKEDRARLKARATVRVGDISANGRRLRVESLP